MNFDFGTDYNPPKWSPAESSSPLLDYKPPTVGLQDYSTKFSIKQFKPIFLNSNENNMLRAK